MISILLRRLLQALVGALIVGLTAGIVGYFGFPLLGDLSRLTPEQLASIAGVVLVFALDKLPFLSVWFNGLDPVGKGWAAGGSNIGLAVALFALACFGRLGEAAAISCSLAGAVGLLSLVLASLVTSQAAYLMFIRPKSQPQARSGG